MAFDKPTRNRLASFVAEVRRLIADEFTQQFQSLYGISDKGTITPLDQLGHLDDAGLATAGLLRKRIDYLINPPRTTARALKPLSPAWPENRPSPSSTAWQPSAWRKHVALSLNPSATAINHGDSRSLNRWPAPAWVTPTSATVAISSVSLTNWPWTLGASLTAAHPRGYLA